MQEYSAFVSKNRSYSCFFSKKMTKMEGYKPLLRKKRKKKNQLVCIYYQVFIDDYNKRQQPIKCQCCPQCCSGILAESINKTICPSNTVTFIVFNDSA